MEDRMGFFDRFRKKKKANAEAKASEPAKAAEPPKKERVVPTDPVEKSFFLAREFNEANVAAGKYDQAKAATFEAQIAEIEASGADADTKMVQVSQLRGGMLIAAQIKANQVA